MRSFARLATAGAVVLGVALPSGAGPTLRTETGFFHCAPDRTTPSTTANSVIGDPSIPGWAENAPAGSFTSGDGCVGTTSNLVYGLSYNSQYDVPIEGTFVGNIDSITIRAYFLPSRGRPAVISVRLHLGIDGKSMFGTDTNDTGFTGPTVRNVNVPATYTGEGLARVEFTVIKIGWLVEEGDGEIERTVNVTLASQSDAVGTVLMDTTEAPAGLTFNPPTPAPTTVKATTPGPD